VRGLPDPAVVRPRGSVIIDRQTRRDLSRDLLSESLANGRAVTLNTDGLSMGRTIRRTDRIVVEGADPERLAPGDLILYRTAHGLVAHRVIRLPRAGGDPRLQTMGDGHLAPDEPIAHAQIIGRVTAIIAGKRRITLHGGTARCAARAQAAYSRALARIAAVCRGRIPHPILDVLRPLLRLPTHTLAALWRVTAARRY